jgi:hypothetical protein
MLPLGLASKQGLHPAAIAHLSPGTSSLLVTRYELVAPQMQEGSTQMLYAFVLCCMRVLCTR